MSNEPGKFESWALVEVMGHSRFSGLASESSIGGASFLRIDVPEVTLPDGLKLQPFTRFLGGSSIFSITPVSEETAHKLASQIQAQPISVWSIRDAVERIKQQPSRIGTGPSTEGDCEFDEEDPVF